VSTHTQSVSHVYTLSELASLGYPTPQTLRNHIRSGRLPARKVGNRYVVSADDLDAWSTATDPTGALDDAVARLVAAAPQLTEEQVRRLASLLGGAS
jgi:excisionase family DNA binding protein